MCSGVTQTFVHRPGLMSDHTSKIIAFTLALLKMLKTVTSKGMTSLSSCMKISYTFNGGKTNTKETTRCAMILGNCPT